tara:strand:- start:131927 stop:132664 length:738 start_codon:yes stop_codon:yes gene_type:complete
MQLSLDVNVGGPLLPSGHAHDHVSRIEHCDNVNLEMDVLTQNDELAEANRDFFSRSSIVAINLLSSPGAGKTTLLVDTISKLKSSIEFYVVEGDQQTLNDAQRISATGVPVVQINTGDGCHLDASMVDRACKELKPTNGSILFIENVGNLVCPAMFDLGEIYRVVIVSITEGEDKPLKYPNIFESADICIINKIDLLPYIIFDIELLKENIRRVNPHALIFENTNQSEGTGWLNWMRRIMRGVTN